jgi:hypothetical protein
MHRLLRPMGLAGAALILAGSCSATKVVHSWRAPGFDKAAIKKVLVLGVSPNPAIRRTYEDTFSVELEKLGYQAVSGFLWAPDATNIDRDAVVARIRAEHVTHVLVTRIVKVQEVASYHAPTTVGVGYGGYGPAYYGSWSSYYAVGYSTVVSPGYVTVDNVVELETNLYDASKTDDALVWSGQSQTWTDQAQSGSKIDDVISALVYQMRAQKVL